MVSCSSESQSSWRCLRAYCSHRFEPVIRIPWYVHPPWLQYIFQCIHSFPSFSILLVESSVVPRVLPAQKRWSVLLRAVHQLPLLAPCVPASIDTTYEEPHGGAEAGSHESVQRSDRVDVDGVVRHLRIFGRAHAGQCGLHGVCEPGDMSASWHVCIVCAGRRTCKLCRAMAG